MPNNDKTEDVRNKVCQSCARPLIDEVRGTNKDKTSSEDYCRFCFLEGEFRNSNLTKEEAVNRLMSVFMTKSQTAEVQANSMAEEIISKLKRWEEN